MIIVDDPQRVRWIPVGGLTQRVMPLAYMEGKKTLSHRA